MKATEDLLATLHSAVAQDLLKRIKAGEASPQLINAAIKFLKDNGIEVDPANSEDLDALKNLPVFDQEYDPEEDANIVPFGNR